MIRNRPGHKTFEISLNAYKSPEDFFFKNAVTQISVKNKIQQLKLV